MGWIVGSSAQVTFCDAALAFCAFYRGLQRGTAFDVLIPAVKAASGIDDFEVEYGHLIQQRYQHELIQRAFEALRKKTSQAANSTNTLPHLGLPPFNKLRSFSQK